MSVQELGGLSQDEAALVADLLRNLNLPVLTGGAAQAQVRRAAVGCTSEWEQTYASIDVPLLQARNTG